MTHKELEEIARRYNEQTAEIRANQYDSLHGNRAHEPFNHLFVCDCGQLLFEKMSPGAQVEHNRRYHGERY